MTFIFFIAYMIVNALILILILSKVNLYKANQKEYDHMDVVLEKTNKDWFYYLLAELNIKGHAYQVSGKGFNHYYKQELKMLFLGKDFFYTTTIYSLYAIFFNIALINTHESDNKFFKIYFQYHMYYAWVLGISFVGSFLMFVPGMFVSGLIFFLVYVCCIVLEFLLASHLEKESIALMQKYIPNLKDEDKLVIQKLAKTESFYFFSVMLNKRSKLKGYD